MQDRPEAAELLEAVAGFLFTEVRGWVPDDRQFQVLVAANSCAIVAREMRLGSAAAEADLKLFREILDEPAAAVPGEDVATATRQAALALVTRIRAGGTDDDLDQLARRLRDHVRHKLEVSRPGYAEAEALPGAR